MTPATPSPAARHTGTAPPRSAEFIANVARILAVVREASALGAGFRVSGTTIAISSLERLPEPLRALLQRWNDAGWLWAQLADQRAERAAVAFCASLDVVPWLVEDADETELAVAALDDHKSEHGNLVGFDLETTPKPEYGKPRPTIRLTQHGITHEKQPGREDRTGLDAHLSNIASLQLYAGGGVCFIFRGAALQCLLASGWLRQQHLVIHNSPFELSFLHRAVVKGAAANGAAGNGAAPNGASHSRIECTMQAGGLVCGVNAYGGGRGLDTVSEKLLGVKPPKHYQTSDWGAAVLSNGQLAYAAADAVLARRLWPKIAERLDADELWEAYELQRRAAFAVTDMRLRGIGFDREEHRRQADVWAADLNWAQAKYRTLTGRHPPEKPEQLRDWLRSVLSERQLSTWAVTPTQHVLSVAGRDLKRLVGVDSAAPVLQILAKTKLISSFGPKLTEHINPATGRLHGDYWTGGAKSGRFTCSKPNLQQSPARRYPEFRRCFTAAPGCLLIVGDYSQIELRALAFLSRDPVLTRIFVDGRDAHREMAARIAGVAPDEVTKEQRDSAKPVNFGLAYGAGARTVQANIFDDYGIEITEQQAQRLVDTAHRMYRRLTAYQHDFHRQCQRQGYVRIPGAGRLVKAAWEKSGEIYFTQACNLPVQGIAADCTLRALDLVYRALRRESIHGGLVGTVHDEFLLEVVTADAERAKALLDAAMLQAFEETFPGAPTLKLIASGIGGNWEEAKPQ
jgi:DNA polymerase I